MQARSCHAKTVRAQLQRLYREHQQGDLLIPQARMYRAHSELPARTCMRTMSGLQRARLFAHPFVPWNAVKNNKTVNHKLKRHACMREQDWRCSMRVSAKRSPCRAYAACIHACSGASPFCAFCCSRSQSQYVRPTSCDALRRKWEAIRTV